METSTASGPVPAPSPARLADDLLQVWLDAEPVRASLYGFHDFDARLADLTDDAERARAARLRELSAAAAAVDPAGLGPPDRVTVEVVRTVAADTADTLDTRQLEWQVTDLFVAPASGLLTFLPLLPLGEPAHAEAYLLRLGEVGRYLAEAADRQRAGVASGLIPVARLARAAVSQVDRYLADPGHDPLLRPEPPAGWDGADRFRADRERLLADVVRPAFRRYRDVLSDEIVPRGRDDEHVGLSLLPGGAQSYATLVRAQTTTDRTPEDLHHVGLDVLARLDEEYAELGGPVLGTADAAEVRRRLREDRDLRFRSAEEILDAARRAVARAEQAAPGWFGRLPAQRCVIKAVPEAEAARAPGAYYTPAALDGSRQGTYWQSTHEPEQQPRHSLESTAFHEAVPGHHFQSALTQELRDVPTLRRVVELTAYDEGWGLYSERLADEMGVYSDDLARLGMVAGDSMRACRLVVDTGMHALGWTRERAVEFMRANAAMAPQEIDVEIDRYIADPAQALAYMVGRLEIQRIRADAERRLDGFDARAFHDVVLGAGSLPLAVLADRVDAWVRGLLGP
jgi:uncharacterized protein (DUF885 family)